MPPQILPFFPCSMYNTIHDCVRGLCQIHGVRMAPLSRKLRDLSSKRIISRGQLYVTMSMYHQWSVLVCNATSNNDLHFSIVKDFWNLCSHCCKYMYTVTTWDFHVVARQSVHSTGTLLVFKKNLVTMSTFYKKFLSTNRFLSMAIFYPNMVIDLKLSSRL